MNPLKRTYCRTFQTILKLSIPFLPYRKPKILGSIKAIPEILKKKKINSVLIVTDKGLMELGLLDRMKQALSDHNISYIIYDDTVANPTTVNVYEAAEL